MKKPVGKFGTILIILATVVLAGVAIFTAYRLYQLRQQPVAPNVPSSQPKAEFTSEPDHRTRRGGCSLSFTIATVTTPTATPRVTPTATPTATPRVTPTATPGATTTPTTSPTTTATVTSTPLAGVTSPAPTQASLPVSGASWPTLLGAGIGILVILGAMLLAL